MSANMISLNVVGVSGRPVTAYVLGVQADFIKTTIAKTYTAIPTAVSSVMIMDGYAGTTFTIYQVTDTLSTIQSAINATTSTTTSLIQNHTPVSINATAVATAAQVASGYIKSTSVGATVITLPTGTLLGAQIGANQGTILDLFVDNTAGASLVTIAVAVNGILSAAAAANAASQGLLTVPSGVTGQACFRIMFSSATAYTFTRVA
tara:strand:- start:13273 stop:13890 length:618 start_codon:yes stop_codon:yes gene_type:complete